MGSADMIRKILLALLVIITVGPLVAMEAPGYKTFETGSYDETAFKKITNNMFIFNTAAEQLIIQQLDSQRYLVTLAVPDDLTTLLWFAAYSGKLRVAKYILDTGSSFGIDPATAINHQTINKATALGIAAYRGHRDIVEYLITLNPSQENIKNALEQTSSKYPEIVMMLFKKLNPEEQKPQGRPAQQGYRIFERGSPERATFDKILLLTFNDRIDDQEIIKLINQNKESVIETLADNNSLLIFAAAYERWNIVKYIINLGIDLGLDGTTAVNHKNNQGATALARAAQLNNIDMVKYLLQFNPSQENIRTAFRWAGTDPEIIALLQSKLNSEQPEQEEGQPKPQKRPAPQAQPAPAKQTQTHLPDFRPGATPRQVLGLPYTASLNDAKRAYRKLSMIYHPDKFNDNKALLAGEEFIHLNRREKHSPRLAMHGIG